MGAFGKSIGMFLESRGQLGILEILLILYFQKRAWFNIWKNYILFIFGRSVILQSLTVQYSTVYGFTLYIFIIFIDQKWRLLYTFFSTFLANTALCYVIHTVLHKETLNDLSF